ncbi:MAG: CZB domain-containing protein [Magnetococcales bacterium]|nr:CZB domain-containing protein [Magnetococcales bacterium]
MTIYSSLSSFIRRSVSRKILAVTGVLGAVLLMALGLILIHFLERGLAEQNRDAIARIAKTASQGLQAIMLAGQAPIAHDFIDKLKEVEGLETMGIYRIDGSEAFFPKADGRNMDASMKDKFQEAIQERQEVVLTSVGTDGMGRMTILSPLLNREPCHACHGSEHPVRGVFQLTLSQAKSERHLRSARMVSMTVVAVAIPALILLIHLVLVRIVQRPMAHLSEAIDRISRGDLTHRIPLPPEPWDGMGQIARDVNLMTSRFGTTIRQVFLQTHSMAACVNELADVRQMLAEDSVRSLRLSEETALDHDLVERQVTTIREVILHTTEQVGAISSATEQLSDNIASIAAGAEETSNNIHTMALSSEEITTSITGVNESLGKVDDSVTAVAASVSEMTLSLEQVRFRCQQASRESQQANVQAQGTHEVMARLDHSTAEIGKVLDLIIGIADQTNMLALNASIEAAGAGESGKGFAVVANEVKELARQTTEATHLISSRIQEIQDNTRQVAEANRSIVDSIGRIDKSNEEISSAVDEQTDSISGIARSMNEVAHAAGEVTRSSQELSLVAQDIARSAMEAAHSATDVARLAAEAASAADTLARQTEKIHASAQRVSTSAQEAAAATTRANVKVQDIQHTFALVHGAIHHTSLLINSVAVPGRQLERSVHDLTMTAEPFPVEKIKGAHLKWLGKLENVLRGRSDLRPEQVASGRECDFGKWYYSDGSARFGGMDSFQRVGEVHLQVHEVARATVKLASEGDTTGAERKMDEFSDIKDQLFALLDEFYLEAAKEER